MFNDTIIAISTALQEGAISIIRMSGPEAIEIMNKYFSKDVESIESHRIVYGNFVYDQEVIDEVLISVFKGPKSYTTEDIVEINCHGGTYVTRKILSILLADNVRLAAPGEFTQRAFLNGRIDLTQAEAVNDIITAQNEYASKMAIKGLKGSIKRILDPLVSDMLNVIAQIEVNIDYPEYDDVAIMTNDLVIPKVTGWIVQVDRMVEMANQGRQLKKGLKTVIVGKPNVGKSSIFNALLEENKAIVTSVAGTTRDIVEGVVQVGDVRLHLLDTAGIRNTVDIVEQIGIEKTNEALKEAELIILVLDATTNITSEEQELITSLKEREHIIVYNKVDSNSSKQGISALNNDIEYLKQVIEKKYQTLKDIVNVEVLSNERQISLAMSAASSLRQALYAAKDELELDLVVIDIEQAYTSLKEITGEVSKDDLLDTLFKNFCLGK